MKNFAEIQAATSAELIAFYNTHNAEKPIKKFTNRETAEKRVLALVEDLEAAEAAKKPKQKAAHVPVIIRAPKKEAATQDAPKTQEVDHSASNALIAQMLAKEAAQLAETEKKPETAPVVETEKKTEIVAPVNPANWATKGRASNSAGVAASWADPEVAAARLTRDGVKVTFEGTAKEFKSVNEAFHDYRLPVSKHIRFRLKLKASGKETFEFAGKKYEFEIVRILAS